MIQKRLVVVAGASVPHTKTEDVAMAVGERINLNKASKDELVSIPGVGAVLAERIIRLRTEKKKIAAVEDLMKIKGIGKKRLDKIRPFVSLE